MDTVKQLIATLMLNMEDQLYKEETLSNTAKQSLAAPKLYVYTFPWTWGTAGSATGGDTLYNHIQASSPLCCRTWFKKKLVEGVGYRRHRSVLTQK